MQGVPHHELRSSHHEASVEGMRPMAFSPHFPTTLDLLISLDHPTISLHNRRLGRWNRSGLESRPAAHPPGEVCETPPLVCWRAFPLPSPSFTT